ncbi:unnamed protein product [Umbelopsis vinacea]
MNGKLNHKITLSMDEISQDDEDALFDTQDDEDALFDAQDAYSSQIAQAHHAKSQYGFKSIHSIVLRTSSSVL